MKKIKHMSAFIECAQGIVPTVSTIKNYIRIISEMGYDTLYLGLADAYKIPEEPYFNYKRGGYTQEDFKEMDAYAKSKNVELVGQIHTLSHLHFLKKYPEYTEIFDTDNVLMVGEDRVYELIENMIKAISNGLSTRRIHLGLDEVFGIGTGNYLKKHGKADKKELILSHLSKVVSIAEKYGLTCEIWGDMLIEKEGTCVTAEEVKKRLPESTLVYMWDYSSGDENKFSDMINNMRKYTNHIGVAGTAWKFLGFGPNIEYSLLGILPQIDACYKCGIDNYMITMWADQSAPCSIYTVLPALYVAAEYANGNYNGVDNLDKEKFYKITGVKYDDMYSFEYINYPLKEKVKTLSSSSFWVFFNDILLGNFDLFLPDGIEKNYTELACYYAKLTKGEFGHIFKVCEYLMQVFAIKAPLNKKIRNAYEKKDVKECKKAIKEIKKLCKKLEEFIQVFEESYLHDNRGFGLEIHHTDFGNTVFRCKYAIKRLNAFIKNGEKIDELEGGVLPINYTPPVTASNSCMVDYRMVMSYCIQ